MSRRARQTNRDVRKYRVEKMERERQREPLRETEREGEGGW